MRGKKALGLAFAGFVAFAFMDCTDSDKLDQLKSEVPNHGDTSSSTGSSTVMDENYFCQCLGALDDPDMATKTACDDCFKAAADGSCSNLAVACMADPLCAAVFNCFGLCGGYSPECITQCLFPLDADEGHELEAMALGCGCNACKSKCTPSAPVTCPAPSGTGGGGAGGTGGGGGSGGASSSSSGGAGGA